MYVNVSQRCLSRDLHIRSEWLLSHPDSSADRSLSWLKVSLVPWSRVLRSKVLASSLLFSSLHTFCFCIKSPHIFITEKVLRKIIDLA